jgi:CubicO group peptidase (beta-lactamase class C family)
MVAGRVAEVVTGQDFPSLLDELLLKPIGSEVATFAPSAELAARMPVFYERDQTGLHVRTREAALRTINPGGGLVSTLDDVGRMLLLHRNRGQVDGKQIVPAEWLEKMYVPQPATGPNGYGLGFNVLRKRPDGTAQRVQHIGASGTLALLDFDADVIVVVFTQVGGGRNQWRDQLVQTIGTVFGGGRE